MRIYVLVALMIVLYLLPWVVSPSASLSPNAYDLAELTSLHPRVRDEAPPLLTSLLLRLPLVCVALLVAYTARRIFASSMIVILIALALLPPLEFIRATDDPNYRQQAVLAAVALIGGAGGVFLSARAKRARQLLAAAIALVGAGAGSAGLLQGYSLLQQLEVPVQVGFAGVGLAILLVGFAGLSFTNQTG